MVFFSNFREQDGPVEMKIIFDNKLEALKLYYELHETKLVWSMEADNFFAALHSAGQPPKLH